MHKLENTANAPLGAALMQFQSTGETPAVSVLTDSVRRPPQTDGGQWEDDATRKRQTISFMTDDGPQSISGIVPESEAVEINAAHKVVCAVRLEASLRPTRQVGGVSRAYTALELVQVLEVWGTPSKCLYRANGGAPGANGRAVEVKTMTAADFAGVGARK